MRSAQAEHPGRFGLVDVDGSQASWDALALVAGGDESQVALRDGRVLVPRLGRAVAGVALPETEAFGADGTVLITGGTGGLGALVARHLVVEHGARDLVLLGRQGLAAEGAPELREELTALGSRVQVVACDVSDRGALAAVIDAIPVQRPLRAVVHAAGVVDDGVIGSLDGERLGRVLRPKVDGALHLDALTRELGLSAFVVFSSAAGILGSPGQGNYAAANAALDALAERRRREGLPGVSLAWGLWGRATGITGQLSESDVVRLGRSGIVPLSDEQGLALFERSVRGGRPVVLPVQLDLAVLRRTTQR